MRVCCDCKRTDVEFHKKQIRCKKCNYKKVKEWRWNNKDKWHAQNKKRKDAARQRKASEIQESE